MTKGQPSRAPRFLPVVRGDQQWLIDRKDGGSIEIGPFSAWGEAKAYIKRTKDADANGEDGQRSDK